jgi:hypothetical protein
MFTGRGWKKEEEEEDDYGNAVSGPVKNVFDNASIGLIKKTDNDERIII